MRFSLNMKKLRLKISLPGPFSFTRGNNERQRESLDRKQRAIRSLLGSWPLPPPPLCFSGGGRKILHSTFTKQTL